MKLNHHLRTSGPARIPVAVPALAALALLSVAPAALAQSNGWGTQENGYGQYHVSNGSAVVRNNWKPTTGTGDQRHERHGSAGSDDGTTGSRAPTQ